MNRIVNVILICLTACCLVACGMQEKAPATAPEGFIPATVRDFSGLDGCKYILVGDDSVKYEPINLHPEFQKDGLRVFFRFKLSDTMSICMVGKQVSVTEIKRAEK